VQLSADNSQRDGETLCGITRMAFFVNQWKLTMPPQSFSLSFFALLRSLIYRAQCDEILGVYQLQEDNLRNYFGRLRK
jgi:hypothetical protein